MSNHIDPVCGMPVEGQKAAGLSEHQGTTYYLDSEESLGEFIQQPAQHAGQSPEQLTLGPANRSRA